jgi:hypothetical protein
MHDPVGGKNVGGRYLNNGNDSKRMAIAINWQQCHIEARFRTDRVNNFN